MQEPHEKGVATHLDPESCVVVREGGSEALTGAHVGRAIEPRNLKRRASGVLPGATALNGSEWQHRRWRYRESVSGWARSKTSSTHGNISHGSREIPRLSAVGGTADRKAKSRDEELR
jgi:hypothetical protein